MSFYLLLVFIFGAGIKLGSRTVLLVSAMIAALIGIFGILPIRCFFKKMSNYIFLKNDYNYSETLQTLSEIIYKNIEHNELTEKTSEVLQKIFKTTTIHFALYNDIASDLKDKDCDNYFRVPITFQTKLVGMIILGPKRSGHPYTRRDEKLLRTFGYQMATALEKAHLYDQVKEYTTSLEHKVQERTKDIQNMQKEQEQVIIDISHNLQTPLTVLKAQTNLLIQSVKDPKQLFVFEKTIDDLSHFIYRLLDFAKFGMGNNDVLYTSISLSKLLSQEVEYFKTIAHESGVRVYSNIIDSVHVCCDTGSIKELLVNLVSNAIKYRKNTTNDAVWVSLRKKDDKAIIIVRDNGIGISKQDIVDIFRRFYRAKKQKKNSVGTGLGLAISKKIVEHHGGSITVESEELIGTSFIISLPCL